MWKHEKKVKIQFLVTKRSQKSNSTYFSNFRYYLYSNSGLLFLIRISFEGSNFKKHFSLTFYAKTPKKMAKYSFRLQKGVKIQNLIIGMCPRPKNKGGFIYQNSRQTSGTYL